MSWRIRVGVFFISAGAPCPRKLTNCVLAVALVLPGTTCTVPVRVGPVSGASLCWRFSNFRFGGAETGSIPPSLRRRAGGGFAHLTATLLLVPGKSRVGKEEDVDAKRGL
jgi:hypothetical protein